MKNLVLSFSVLFAVVAMFSACSKAPEGEAAKTGEAKEPAAKASAGASTYQVASGIITWVGSKTAYKHTGTIQVKSGEIAVENNDITGGNFVIDMNTINNIDLKDKPEKKADLEGHLKSDDFFNAEQFPESTFEITQVEKAAEGGDATHNITGNLTIRGIKKSVTIPAKVEIDDTKIRATTPDFTINRTNWGANFNSTILKTAADQLINDNIGLKLNLTAVKKS